MGHGSIHPLTGRQTLGIEPEGTIAFSYSMIDLRTSRRYKPQDLPTTAHILGAINSFYNSPITEKDAHDLYRSYLRKQTGAARGRGRRQINDPQFPTISNKAANLLLSFLQKKGPAPLYNDIMERSFIFTGLEYRDDRIFQGSYKVVVEMR